MIMYRPKTIFYPKSYSEASQTFKKIKNMFQLKSVGLCSAMNERYHLEISVIDEVITVMLSQWQEITTDQVDKIIVPLITKYNIMTADKARQKSLQIANKIRLFIIENYDLAPSLERMEQDLHLSQDIILKVLKTKDDFDSMLPDQQESFLLTYLDPQNFY